MHILESEKVTHVLEKVSEGEFLKHQHHPSSRMNLMEQVISDTFEWMTGDFQMSWPSSFVLYLEDYASI